MDVISLIDEPHVDWVVDVINEFSTPTRAAAGELDDTIRTVATPVGAVEGVTIEDLVAVADAWFEVFRAAHDPEAVSDVLNSLLIEANPTIRATIERQVVSATIEFATAATAAQRLAVRGALALLDVIAEIGLERMGLCSAEHCVDVYVDRSPRRNRRYCSQLCQTRQRVQRHRSNNRK